MRVLGHYYHILVSNQNAFSKSEVLNFFLSSPAL